MRQGVAASRGVQHGRVVDVEGQLHAQNPWESLGSRTSWESEFNSSVTVIVSGEDKQGRRLSVNKQAECSRYVSPTTLVSDPPSTSDHVI